MKRNIIVALLVVLSAGCQSATPIPPPTPAGQVETQVAATISAGQTSTAAVEQAVKLTLTAAVPSPTDTLPPSPTPEPTTAVPLTDTPAPTATKKPAALPTATQAPTNADAIAGMWSGTAKNGDFAFQVTVTIGKSCAIGSVCGPFDIPAIPCSGTFTLIGIRGTTYQFQAGNYQGSCTPGASDFLQLLPDGTLYYISRSPSFGESNGVLVKVGG